MKPKEEQQPILLNIQKVYERVGYERTSKSKHTINTKKCMYNNIYTHGSQMMFGSVIFRFLFCSYIIMIFVHFHFCHCCVSFVCSVVLNLIFVGQKCNVRNKMYKWMVIRSTLTAILTNKFIKMNHCIVHCTRSPSLQRWEWRNSL